MAMHDPVLHQFISYLSEKKEEQEATPSRHLKIELSRQFIASVREAFKQNILDGERQLHVLSHLLSSVLLEGEFELHSNVIGVLPGGGDRPFHIRERITRETLSSVTDIDLGNQMLDNFRYRKEDDWVPLELSANFVEYLPAGRTHNGVNRLTSRVKAEEELWNKVTDELFHVDELLTRDKHLKQYSKYVKDIFGIKVVCEDEQTCITVHDKVQDVSLGGPGWEQSESAEPAYTSRRREAENVYLTDPGWARIGFGEKLFDQKDNLRKQSDRLLEFIETKNYLTCPDSEMKKTGWKALKSVARWHDRLFEIQFQPVGNYYLELDHMAGPSHRSFKLQRDYMRDELAQRIPLYGFYRDLLKMLFLRADVSFEYKDASVVIK
jgi:hypothetical protein